MIITDCNIIKIMPLHDIEAEIVLHFFHIYALQNWLADVGIMHFHCEVHQGKLYTEIHLPTLWLRKIL